MKLTIFYGHGIAEDGAHKRTRYNPAYIAWQNMLRRCYDTKQPYYKNYEACEVHEDFRRFQDFADWAVYQVGFNCDGFQLDKDVIGRGSAIYSPETCAFLPYQINSLFSGLRRADDLPGVNRVKGQFLARCRVDNRQISSRFFDTPEEAHLAYCEMKDANVQRMAEIWKDRIYWRAYESLKEYRTPRVALAKKGIAADESGLPR